MPALARACREDSKVMTTEPIWRPITTDEFRRCFQLQVSTVTIVTAHDGERRAGLTATSVCSLMDSPPSLLVSLGRGSQSCPMILGSRRFAVNIMQESQAETAKAFARHAGDAEAGEQKFRDSGTWTEGPGGVPLLDGCLANLVCNVIESTTMKTHTVFFGLVTAVRFPIEGRPLLYGFRQFCSLAA
jgi:flavin reductase (DIM6/NTAB) family NADH-FMN oxidoreductase RutF